MEISAKSLSTGRPLRNVGVVGKTIKMHFSASATDDEIDHLVTSVLDKYNVEDAVNILYYEEEVLICVKPICPFCDMDFGYHSFLNQHLNSERCESS